MSRRSGITSTTGVTRPSVIATGLTPNDIGAVSQDGGGAERIVVANNVSGTYTIDLDAGNYFALTVTGDTNIVMPTVTAGYALGFVVHLFYSGTGIDITFETEPTLTWLEGVSPTLDTTSGNNDIFSFLNEGSVGAFYGLHVTSRLTIPSYIDIRSSTAPASPDSGVIRMWFDSTLQHLLLKNSAGTVFDVTAALSAPAAGQITAVGGQSVTGKSAAAAGSFTLVLPSTPTSGNHVVAIFGTDATGAITAPSGWTVDKEYAGTHGIGKIGVYRIKSTGIVGDKTATWTFSGTHLAFGEMVEYAGMTASPVDTTPAGTETAGASSLAITTGVLAQAAELIVVGALTGSEYGGSGSVGWSTSGFATIYDSGSGAAGSKATSATTSVTSTITFPGSVPASMVAVSYKAA